MKKKKIIHAFDNEDFVEDIEENYVIGIITSLSHLQLVHFLNKTGYFYFEKTDEIELELKNEKALFIQYLSQDPEFGDRFKLIKNKGISALELYSASNSATLNQEPKNYGNLGKEFKNLDYILILDSENLEPIHQISDRLRLQKFVQATVEVDSDQISEKVKKLIHF